MKKKILTLLAAAVIVAGILLVATPAAQAATQTCLSGDRSAMTVSVDTVLDLNGYDITTLTVESGVTVTIKDSQTDDYDSENGRGYGVIANIAGDGTVIAEEDYLLIEDNGTSAHKLKLSVSGVSLRVNDLTDKGASMYYQCTFAGDQIVKDNVTAYGVAMGAGEAPAFWRNTYTKNTDMSTWIIGEAFNGNSVLLKGVMRSGNTATINQRNSEMDVYCQAYIELDNGQRVTGQCVQLSLRDLVAGTEGVIGVEQQMSTLTAAEKDAAKKLYSGFTAIVDTWGVPQIRQAVTGGAYQIKIPQDMRILSDKPDGSINLINNVDMTGVDFAPIASFSGTFNGNNKTISNLSVDAESGNTIGMFMEIGAGGRIYNLKLENITVDACGTDARYVGTIAGKTYGAIENCTVTGTILHDREATATAKVFIGAFVGKSEAGSVTRGGTSLSITDTVTNVNGKTVTYTTTGLCAKVKMNVPDSPYMMRRLVGNTSTGGTCSGDWQDLSFSTEDDSALVQSRRAAAVNEMVKMGTFKWTVPNLQTNANTPDLVHYGTTDTTKQNSHTHTQKFYSGTVYYGIPYDHTSSSYEQAMFYLEEGANGVYLLNEEAAASGNSTWQINGTDAHGNAVYLGFTKYLGNDCSGAVAWAWHHAVPRWEGGGGVCVLLSSDMIPTDATQTNYGIYRVGPYTVTNNMTAVVNKQNVITTPAIARANGKDTMYESYARAQMGDGLIYGEPGGHARLVAADSVVIRNAAGAIYETKSYILVHEQGDGLYDRATTNSSWRINYKYTFSDLYNGTAKVNGKHISSGSGYLPITLKAYHDESVPVMSTVPYEYDKAEQILTPDQGQLNAGNRILCATVTVKDSAGNVVYNRTAYKGATGIFKDYRSAKNNLTMQMKFYFSDYVDYVQSGKTYTFCVDCTVAGGTLNADGTISNTTVNVIKDRSFIAP